MEKVNIFKLKQYIKVFGDATLARVGHVNDLVVQTEDAIATAIAAIPPDSGSPFPAGTATAPGMVVGVNDNGQYEVSGVQQGFSIGNTLVGGYNASGLFTGTITEQIVGVGVSVIGALYSTAEVHGQRFIKEQVSPVNSNTDPAPMGVAGMTRGLLTATLAAAINYTLPTGTQMDTFASAFVAIDESFDFSIINIGAGGTITVVAAAGFTIVGSDQISVNTSGWFRARKTAANTYVLYRLN